MKIIVLLLTAACAFAQNTHTVVIIPDAGDANLGKTRFLEKRANGSNYIDILGQASLSANRTLTLPDKDGTMVVEELDSIARVTNLEATVNAGSYVKTRKVDLADLSGGAGFWDMLASAVAAGQSNFEIRDNGGVSVIKFHRVISGIAVDFADVYVDLQPDTDMGQKLGKSGQRWSAGWFGTLNASGTATLGDVIPQAASAYMIGAPGVAWAQGYFDNITVGSCAGCATGAGNVSVENDDPIIQMKETDASTDGKYWRFTVGAERFDLQAVNDAYTSAAQIFSIPRSGSVLSPIEFSVGVDPASDLIQGLGNPLKQWVNIYGGKVILSDTYPMILSGTGFKYFPSESSHVAWYKKDGAQDFYWRRSATGYPGSETELMSLSDAGLLTLYGNFVPNGTRDIGETANRWNVIYANNVDGAPSGGTGNYVRTRKLDVVDNAGGAGLWDLQAQANMAGNASLFIRDPAGVNVISFSRAVGGTATDNALVFVDWLPDSNLSQKVGSSAARWSAGWFGTLNATGTVTTGDVIPQSASAYMVGAPGVNYAQGYFDNITTTNLTVTNLTCSTCVTTNTTQTITGSKTFSLEVVGSVGFKSDLAGGGGYVAGNKVEIHSPDTTGFWHWNISSGTSGTTANFINVGGGTVLSFSSLTSTMASLNHIVPNTGGTYDLGSSGSLWRKVYTTEVSSGSSITLTAPSVEVSNNLNISGSIRSASAASDLGQSLVPFINVYTNNLRVFTGIVAPNSTSGVSSVLTCSSGQAVKNITVSGGIVTGVSCGAP